jgi:hypothetical protein
VQSRVPKSRLGTSSASWVHHLSFSAFWWLAFKAVIWNATFQLEFLNLDVSLSPIVKLYSWNFQYAVRGLCAPGGEIRIVYVIDSTRQTTSHTRGRPQWQTSCANFWPGNFGRYVQPRAEENVFCITWRPAHKRIIGSLLHLHVIGFGIFWHLVTRRIFRSPFCHIRQIHLLTVAVYQLLCMSSVYRIFSGRCFCLFSEPIQSRCAVLRYSKLTDAQVLSRLLEVCKQENVSYTDDGLEAIIFTAQGDMRQVVLLLHSILFFNSQHSSGYFIWRGKSRLVRLLEAQKNELATIF